MVNPRENTWMPTVAGILDIVAGISAIGGSLPIGFSPSSAAFSGEVTMQQAAASFSPLALPARINPRFRPRSMVGGIEVDPGDQPIPGFRVELHTVVSFLEHLHQLGRIRVELHGHEQVHIAFNSRSAHEFRQFEIADREETAAVTISVAGDIAFVVTRQP